MGHSSELDFITMHKNQLIASGVPELYWKTLETKLKGQIFDAGEYFQIVKLEYDGKKEECDPIFALQALKDISKKDANSIFLIDHCWTFKANEGKKKLLENEKLRLRLAAMFDIDKDLPIDKLVEEIYKYSWKVSGTYSIASNVTAEDRVPVWYIMDELGSAVYHNDNPNCRIVPFMYVNEHTMYSLLFPTDDIEEDYLAKRDYAESVKDPIKKYAALLAWWHKDFTELSPEAPIPDKEYYLSGHIPETLPELSSGEKLDSSKKDKFKVYSQYNLICEYLKDDRFEFVDSEETADIMWYLDHFSDFKELSKTPQKLVNQFPYEYVLTVKDLLSMTCRRSENKDWFPLTYNLNTEIHHFLSCFQSRVKEGLDNYWIVKPYNLARGLDMYITNNVYSLVRMAETGPKIVQKYITNPVLFHRADIGERVKFDIRYVLLLKQSQPLEAYVYKQFFLRFANKSFDLSDFDVYEKHFTVMNYQDNLNLKKCLAEDFKTLWMQQYANYPWEKVESSILKMFRQLFESAVLESAPCGIPASPQSRSLYAADIMLEWTETNEIQPKLLEVNFAPDCKRACEYYPSFYDDIFRLLFLDEKSDGFFEL
ncbi:unnamed protein product [Brassicogethes aeneus]|uniref:Tubulin--tyrosine ligase-like protein 12 SET-like domain-containing protein n=1 Tax=Brassicogethes aeneus TaxID=1431903 RepID=A0A9P0FCY0_BRAAE|nr:unnamed protein product [Brassicogethes aeneus]